jgi:hypothetical protein
MHAIEIGGDRYIKATDAAALTGYATDYIGQLCRGKKVSAERVGRAWYVSEREIVGHKKGTKRSNKQKTHQALKNQMEANGQIHHVYFDPNQEGIMPEYRKRLLAAEVRYEGDKSPLQPNPEKKSRLSEISIEEKIENQGDEGASDEEIKEEADVIEVETNTSDTFQTIDIEPASSDTNFDDEDVTAVRIKAEHKPLKPKKISHIPLEKAEIVPYGKPSYALMGPIARLTVSLALIFSLITSIGGVFLQKVMVYEQGDLALSRPYYETSYGVRAVSAVIESLPK